MGTKQNLVQSYALSYKPKMTLLILIIALSVDQIIGEMKKWHPLVGFGLLANRAEVYFQLKSASYKKNHNIAMQRLLGSLALLVITMPFFVIGYLLTSITSLSLIVNVIVLYFALGAKSLKQHALNIYDPLIESNIPLAKEKTQLIVSRETKQMNENDISKATIESVLENGNDAIFGAIFWFVLAGAPGVILFRLINTLDAMWGYRTEHFLHFGWAAAKLDDAMNYVPARLTAFTYAIIGQMKTKSFKNALFCWQTQSNNWDSPNAGPVMAAGAGALSIKLGGAAVYNNKIRHKPTLGLIASAKPSDIIRAIKLVEHGILLWIFILGLLTFITMKY